MSDGPRTPRPLRRPGRSAYRWRPSRRVRHRRCHSSSPSAPGPSWPSALPPAANLRDRAARRRLRPLSAGVRVDLGVEHEQVHVLPRGEHVVEPPKPMSYAQPSPPTIQTLFFTRASARRAGRASPAPRSPRFVASAAPRARAAVRCRPRSTDPRSRNLPCELLADRGRQVADQRLGVSALLVDRQPHAQTELRVVFEE